MVYHIASFWVGNKWCWFCYCGYHSTQWSVVYF